MAVKSILDPTPKRPTTESNYSSSRVLIQAISGTFSFTTFILIGALLQGIALLFIPRVWILLPTVVVLSARGLRTAAITLKLIPNPQTSGAILSRVTAVVPNTSGEFDNASPTIASESIAVLILGLRTNHPLGYFAPHMSQINGFFDKMNAALDANAPSNGFLGQTSYFATTAEGSPDFALISYWRSIADVHTFAAGPEHKAAWSYWETHAPDLKHIGISHEVFQAPRGLHENVYHNYQPTRLGATSYLRPGDESIGGSVADAWVSPLVDAARGRWRNSKGRLGWKGDSTDEVQRRLAALPENPVVPVPQVKEKKEDSAYEST